MNRMNFSGYAIVDATKSTMEESASPKNMQNVKKNTTTRIATVFVKHKRIAIIVFLSFLTFIAVTFHIHTIRQMEYQSFSFIFREFLVQAQFVGGNYLHIYQLLEDIVISESEPTLAEHQEILRVFHDTVDRQYALLWSIHLFFRDFSVPYHGHPLPWSGCYSGSASFIFYRLYGNTLSIENYIALQNLVEEQMQLFERNGLLVFTEIGHVRRFIIENRDAMWYAIENVSNFAMDFIENEKNFGLALDAIQ